MRDLPAWANRIAFCLSQLPPPLETAIICKFGLFLDENKVEYTNKQKADCMGVGVDRFRSLVRQAEKQLLLMKAHR